jgi:hypothetical protein
MTGDCLGEQERVVGEVQYKEGFEREAVRPNHLF